MLSEAERFTSKASWDDVSICTKFPIVWIFYVPIASKIRFCSIFATQPKFIKSKKRIASLYGRQCLLTHPLSNYVSMKEETSCSQPLNYQPNSWNFNTALGCCKDSAKSCTDSTANMLQAYLRT